MLKRHWIDGLLTFDIDGVAIPLKNIAKRRHGIGYTEIILKDGKSYKVVGKDRMEFNRNINFSYTGRTQIVTEFANEEEAISQLEEKYDELNAFAKKVKQRITTDASEIGNVTIECKTGLNSGRIKQIGDGLRGTSLITVLDWYKRLWLN